MQGAPDAGSDPAPGNALDPRLLECDAMDTLTEHSDFDQDHDCDEPQTVHFEFTRGFKIIVGMMLVPAVALLVIYIGAALVVGDVRAADAQAYYGTSGVEASGAPRTQVAGWKRDLVYVCAWH